ncbi:kinase-like protein [Parathielavia hyrcaniae]|uniref:Kinase-like protein n=1 Tax=Parathielavia hyrcaniae TaxID=113614 RepID=A0AAN6PSS4_9PEZI|nr:kinase-like protein [Parathielavia hyrcaniae]
MSLRVINGDDANYVVVKRLGAGALGTVHKVLRKSDGKVLACKAIQLRSADDLNPIVREVAALRTLAGCRNVVQWTPDVAFDLDSLTIRLHMDYYPDGDLDSLIKSHNVKDSPPVPKDTVTQVFCCLAMGLLDCHSRGICHRDIKPPNILLSRKMWNGQLVTVAFLADFGIGKLSSNPLTSGLALDSSCDAGTPIYMAPESLEPESPMYGAGTDLFALGCTMYELCNRQYAYTDYSRKSVPSMDLTALREYGGTLCPLVTSLMRAAPALRPSTEQLVKTLKEYCASRWEKQKAAMLWESLAVVSQANAVAVDGQAAPPPTRVMQPPWEQPNQQQQAFQLPPALQALQKQQPQQQQQQPPVLPPGLQQARQAHQVHQQYAATWRRVQMQAAEQQQFGGGQPPWNKMGTRP